MATTGLSPAAIAALLSALQGPDVSGTSAGQSVGKEGGGLDAFLGSPRGALLGQLAGGLGEGLLSRPSKEERELSRARTGSLGVGSAAQNSRAFQQLMQLLLQSSGRGGL